MPLSGIKYFKLFSKFEVDSHFSLNKENPSLHFWLSDVELGLKVILPDFIFEFLLIKNLLS